MRVLLVGSTLIGSEGATGSTLYHMFKDMKDVDILQYSLNPLIDTEAQQYRTICAKKHNGIVNYTVYKINAKNRQSNNTGSASLESRKNIKHIIYNQAKKNVLLLQDLLPLKISSDVVAELKNFAPDVIYTLGGGILPLRVSRSLSKLLNAPILLHAMDDHVHTKYAGKGILRKIVFREFYSLNKTIYKESGFGLAISPKMATEYSREFDVPFSSAMNCVEKLYHVPRPQNDKFLIIFSGGVHGGRDITIRQFMEYVTKYNSEIDAKKKVLFEIFTNKVGMNLLSPYQTEDARVYGYVKPDDMFDNLCRANMLLHVESFDPEEQRYFRLSCSTKIPEYLSTGRPLLVIGPKGNGTVDYLMEQNSAYSVQDVYECGKLFEKEEQALSDIEKNSLRTVSNYHLTSVVQDVIVAAFRKVIEHD